MNSLQLLKEDLQELRETHIELAKDLGVSPNFLLTKYFRFGEKALKEIEKLQPN